MPSKKKYNARFPPARIKKIMQTDEEVGKVAAPVPVIISRVLELFVKNLLSNASEFAATNQARTLLSMHLTQAITSDPRLHFLQETLRHHSKVGDGLDLKRGSAAAEEVDAAASSAMAMMRAAPPLPHQHNSTTAVPCPAPAPGPASFSPCISSPQMATTTTGTDENTGATRSLLSGRGRGRPRGRPPKRPLPDLNPISGTTSPTAPTTKRGRGRPRRQPSSPTYVGTDGITVSNPCLNGPFHFSLGQTQASFTHPEPQQYPRSSSLIFPSDLSSPAAYSVPSTAVSTANLCSFTVGQPQFSGASATITFNNSQGSPSNIAHGGGHLLGSPLSIDLSNQSLANGPSSAPITVSSVCDDGCSRESSPHPSSNGSMAGLGGSGRTVLSAPLSQSNPFFSGIKIEIPTLPATNLPFSITSPYGVSISPVLSATPKSKGQSLAASRETMQQQASPLEHRRGSNSCDGITTYHRGDSTNGNAANEPTFTFGGKNTVDKVVSPSPRASVEACTPQASLGGLLRGPLDFSITGTSQHGRHLQSAASSNLDEDYDS